MLLSTSGLGYLRQAAFAAPRRHVPSCSAVSIPPRYVYAHVQGQSRRPCAARLHSSLRLSARSAFAARFPAARIRVPACQSQSRLLTTSQSTSSSMLPFTQVDSFTNTPFCGNPAAVVALPQKDTFPSDDWMQKVAAEMNLSETAFVVSAADPGDGIHYKLRWFTPTVEVDLCGHATLAAAHSLFDHLDAAPAPTPPELRFDTRSGQLIVTRQEGGLLQMDFPMGGPVAWTEDQWASLQHSLSAGLGGLKPLWVGRGTEVDDLLVQVESATEIAELSPDLAELSKMGGRGVVVTAEVADADRAAFQGADIAARFFGPNVGISEDPVTGSAYCTAGPFWAEKLGRDRMLAYQCSARGGKVTVDVKSDTGRVLLAGQAVTVMRGEVCGPPNRPKSIKLGTYSDPCHPGCWRRLVKQVTSPEGEIIGVEITGADGGWDEERECGLDPADPRFDLQEWGPVVAEVKDDTLKVDFGFKGGPSVVGTLGFDPTAEDLQEFEFIQWEDGNRWTWMGPSTEGA